MKQIPAKSYILHSTFYFFSLIVVLFLSGCNGLSPKEKADEMLINYLLDDIEQAVSQYLPNNVIELIHPDFLHNGTDSETLIYIWKERMLLYFSLSIDKRNIVVEDDLAKVSFLMTFRGDNTNIISEEPSEEYGDISYLIKDNGKWYLYGNQQ